MRVLPQYLILGILIDECIKNKIDVFPGASAVTAAISTSGFSGNFFFCGFLPEKKTRMNFSKNFKFKLFFCFFHFT